MKLGDTVWKFDINRRVYRNGRSGPVWREHWRPMTIESETSRSWVCDNGEKLPKKGSCPSGWAIHESDIIDAEWMERKWAIAESVRKVGDVSVLKQIAALTGWQFKGMDE